MFEPGWVASLLPLVAAGFGVGLLVGLTGVGGGAFMTPLLISSFGVSPPVAVGSGVGASSDPTVKYECTQMPKWRKRCCWVKFERRHR
jgi:hypothetical protein